MDQERFSTLQNGIDSRLEIIRDNDTGFYNITKTAKIINKLLKYDNDSQTSLSKYQNVVDFFKMASTNELIDECKQQTNLDKVHYKLKQGIPTQFAGTYVHRLLYDHFLAWLDPRYAIKISIILDRIHQDANQKLLQEKDDAISRLEQSIQKQAEEARTRDAEAKSRDEAQSIKIDQQSAEIQKLLSYAQNTTHQLSEARLDIQDGNDQIDKLTDKIEECRDVIIERMEEHTLNPQSITKRQYFVCLQHPKDTNVLYAIRSQMVNIKKQKKAHPNWKILIDSIEDPNSIKMFIRFKDRVKSIENAWKDEIMLQYRKKEIDYETKKNKLDYIKNNPLISAKVNDIKFDNSRIDIDQVKKLMTDTAFERFKLNVP